MIFEGKASGACGIFRFGADSTCEQYSEKKALCQPETSSVIDIIAFQDYALTAGC